VRPVWVSSSNSSQDAPCHCRSLVLRALKSTIKRDTFSSVMCHWGNVITCEDVRCGKIFYVLRSLLRVRFGCFTLLDNACDKCFVFLSCTDASNVMIPKLAGNRTASSRASLSPNLRTMFRSSVLYPFLRSSRDRLAEKRKTCLRILNIGRAIAYWRNSLPRDDVACDGW